MTFIDGVRQNSEPPLAKFGKDVQVRGNRGIKMVKQVIPDTGHRPSIGPLARISLTYLHLQGRGEGKRQHNFGEKIQLPAIN